MTDPIPRAEYNKCDGPTCPHCGETVSTVRDSRPYRADRTYTRRRRQCSECGQRFTTYESTVQLTKIPPAIKRALRMLQLEINNLLAQPEIDRED